MKKETVLKFIKPLIGLAVGGIGALLMLTNSSYAAVGQTPALQILLICAGLLMCIVAPVLIIPAPHDE